MWIVKLALASAAATYAERFQVSPPTFTVRSSFSVSDFLVTYASVDSPDSPGARTVSPGTAQPRKRATWPSICGRSHSSTRAVCGS